MPDSVSNATRRSKVMSQNSLASTSRTAEAATSVVAVPDRRNPSIYFVDATPDVKQFRAALEMNFNAVGFSEIEASDLARCLDFSKSFRLSVLVDLDILRPDPSAPILVSHPDWLVAAPEGRRFLYLSDLDSAVDYWISKIGMFLEHGVNMFRCLNIMDVSSRIWERLIDAAKRLDSSCRFAAWTPGLSDKDIDAISGVGFDFAFSSSCWWDLQSSWLNDDARRMARLGPSITLATPPRTAWSRQRTERERCLFLAAFYAAGWMMPAGFEFGDDFDLRPLIADLNATRMKNTASLGHTSAHFSSSAGAEIAVLTREGGLALVLNSSLLRSGTLSVASVAPRIGGRLRPISAKNDVVSELDLPPGGFGTYQIIAEAPIRSSKKLSPDCAAPRLAIEAITPKVDDGQFPVRRIIGETVVVEADIIGDGHHKLAAELKWRVAEGASWQRVPMTLVANDRWRAEFPLVRLGRHFFAVAAWQDEFASFVDEIKKKSNAGISIRLEIEEGLRLVRETADKSSGALDSLLLKLESADEAERLAAFLTDDVATIMRDNDVRKFLVESDEVIVDAERLAARFASWYEIFPRSQSGDARRHGNFRDVINQLPRIAGMGFDVLYFPPIHPIGRTNRKGPNNSLSPSAGDPGSPYAIGSEDGGHDALHPELGNFEDFRALIFEAKKLGIELALDFAVQCAPDHPWLKSHKEWFDWRPDGSLRYAENPPKKYEDIVNVDFYSDGAKPALWEALRDIVQFWVDHGIRLFRVDNPHTKPFPFWEWLISDIRRRHPDVVFLAEAFTRPKVMYRLAKIGFSQSYTYFTWRNTKAELTDYMTELNLLPAKEFFRPHFFVNTPDINPIFLQHSGRAGFLIRAALATTLSGLWGVYNGFELCEAASVAPGKEEYLDSEKYQIRVWDYDRPGNIISEITRLNAIRRSNAALQSHLEIQFHQAFDDDVLYFSKSAADGNVVLAAICLDPFNTHTCEIEIPLWLFGLPDDGEVFAMDLMRDFEFVWHGKRQTVTLHPDSPFCIWSICPAGDIAL